MVEIYEIQRKRGTELSEKIKISLRKKRKLKKE